MRRFRLRRRLRKRLEWFTAAGNQNPLAPNTQVSFALANGAFQEEFPRARIIRVVGDITAWAVGAAADTVAQIFVGWWWGATTAIPDVENQGDVTGWAHIDSMVAHLGGSGGVSDNNVAHNMGLQQLHVDLRRPRRWQFDEFNLPFLIMKNGSLTTVGDNIAFVFYLRCLIDAGAR